jgi:hypothetical protein
MEPTLLPAGAPGLNLYSFVVSLLRLRKSTEFTGNNGSCAARVRAAAGDNIAYRHVQSRLYRLHSLLGATFSLFSELLLAIYLRNQDKV